VRHVVGTGWTHKDTMKTLTTVHVDADGWATARQPEQVKTITTRYGSQPSKPSVHETCEKDLPR